MRRGSLRCVTDNATKKHMARAFNRKVRSREFRASDLVLKKVLHISTNPRGKFVPKYEGPYVVKKVLVGGALIITSMDGQEFPNPINADAVKKYFP